jgi:diaminopimelate decarboxylase
MYYIDDGISSSFTESIWLPGYEYSKPTPLKGSKGEKLYPSSIWGQTCASMDYVTKDCSLPEVKIRT